MLLFKRCLMGEKKAGFKLHRLKTGSQLKEAVDLHVGKPIYIDVETNGLNPYKPDFKVWCLSFSADEKEVFSVLVDHPESTINTKDLETGMRTLLLSCPIYAHRVKFEGAWLWRRFGVRPKFAGDTKVNKFLQDENDLNGLKYRAIGELGVQPWEEEFDFSVPPPVKPLLVYNAKDVNYGFRLLKEKDEPWFEAHPAQKRLLDYIVNPAQEVFLEAEYNGFHVDMVTAQRKLDEVEEKLSALTEKIQNEHGIEINLGSPQQVSDLLYDKIGLKCPVKTEKGANSTSEAALIRLQGQHPVIDDMLEDRKLRKYKSTYLSPWIRQGPILHNLFGFTNTVTGRLNGTLVKDKRKEKKTGAGLHQAPRDPFIRNLITPRRKGWHIVASDWSQIELRLVAHASGDPELIRIYRNNLDAHLETAATLATGEITKEVRKKAKAVNFGFIYGMWAKKFRAYAKEKFGLELTMQECIDYRSKFFSKYRGIELWHEKVANYVSKTGYIQSIFNRVRHLPHAKPEEGAEEWVRNEAIRQAINSPIQGAACDLNKFCAALVFHPRSKWDFRADPKRTLFIGAVHDSQLTEVREDYVKEFKAGMEWTSKNMPIERVFGVKIAVPLAMDVVAYEYEWEGKELAA